MALKDQKNLCINMLSGFKYYNAASRYVAPFASRDSVHELFTN